jgi:hypothetical protein
MGRRLDAPRASAGNDVGWDGIETIGRRESRSGDGGSVLCCRWEEFEGAQCGRSGGQYETTFFLCQPTQHRCVAGFSGFRVAQDKHK